MREALKYLAKSKSPDAEARSMQVLTYCLHLVQASMRRQHEPVCVAVCVLHRLNVPLHLLFAFF